MTRIHKLGALTLAMPLVLGSTILGAPQSAEAAAAGITSPASGAVIKHGSSVTVTATASLLGGTLLVHPPAGEAVRLDKGDGNAKLKGSVGIGRNGPYKIELQGVGGGTRTFYVKVPPAAPGGLTATVSGRKLTVRWNLGYEVDLTGYSVVAAGSSRSVGTSCPGSTCSTTFTLPANAGGTAKVAVQARRSTGTGGTLGSAISRGSVTVAAGSTGTGATGSAAGGLPNIPTYATPLGNNTPLTPVNPNSGLNLPTVAPDGSTPGFVYPTPPPEVATQNQVSPNARPVAEVSQMAWGRSLAIALILLVCAAHLGAWTRRLRFAQEGPAAGRLGRRSGGKSRVKKANERIAQAQALAKTGTLSKADVLGKAAATRPPKAAGTAKSGSAARQPTSGSRTGSDGKSPATSSSKSPAESTSEPTGKSTSRSASRSASEPTAKSTPPVAARSTIAESAARSTEPVPPIQPLDRPADTTAPIAMGVEPTGGMTVGQAPGAVKQDRKTSRSPLRRRRRT